VPRHQLHLALTVLTLGVWGICWIITIIAARFEPWRCHECLRPQPDEPAPLKPLRADEAGATFNLIHEHAE
jgi:hypothetical protein